MPKRNGNDGEDNSGKPVLNAVGNNGNTGENSGVAANSGNSPTPVNPATVGHNPDTGSNPASSDSQPRKRGRPRGSTNRSTETQKNIDLSGLQGIISTTHMAIAAMSKNPLWALNDAEVKAYAEAVQNVSRHYDIGVQQKTIDHAMLLVVVGGIYGTRIMAMQRMKQQAPETVDQDAAAAHAASNVHQFSGAPIQ